MPTKIEWTDESWNPVTGCTPISAGCEKCYAANIAKRFWGDRKFSDIEFHVNRINIPFKWKKPRRIFVGSMGDLFHEDVKWEWRMSILSMMMRCAQHTFVLLTKRPENALNFCIESGLMPTGIEIVGEGPQLASTPSGVEWPENVWFGVTAENQKTAEERIPILLQIPAAVRFVSVEPMLELINLNCLFDWHCPQCNSLNPQIIWPCPECKGDRYKSIDWVICGAETGPGARPMNPEWAIDLYDQCKAAGVPFFFKKESKGMPVPDYVKNTREFPV